MTAPATQGARVLVVDDEADIVALVAFHLAKSGYRVSTAANGTDALAAARQERPMLIVLDLMLPGMSGLDVLRELRANESTRDIAVLLLTARREEQDRIGATVFARDGDDWTGHVLADADVLAMPEIGIEVPLAELYAGLDFADAGDAAGETQH